jgi:hypothetical protein
MGIRMENKCELLNKCGFFKKYQGTKDLACKWFMLSYCKGLKMNECKMIEINEVRISIDQIYFNIYGLVAANNKAAKDSFNAAIAKSRAEYKERLEDLQSKAKTQVGKDLLQKLNEEVINARSINQQIITMALKVNDRAWGKKFDGCREV